MRNRIGEVLVAAVLATALLGCEQPEDEIEESVSAPGQSGVYATRGTAYTWPEPAQNTVLAPNWLATNYYIVFDGSGSMEEVGCSDDRRKIDVAKEAVQQFLGQIPADANVGLYVFDDQGRREVQALGAPRAALTEAVAAIVAGGGTPLRSSVQGGLDALTAQAQTQLGYGDYHLVVVTDGEANSGQDPHKVVQKMLAQSPVILHTIGFCIGEGHSLNVKDQTYYHAANNPAELSAGLAQVLAEASDYTDAAFTPGAAEPVTP